MSVSRSAGRRPGDGMALAVTSRQLIGGAGRDDRRTAALRHPKALPSTDRPEWVVKA